MRLMRILGLCLLLAGMVAAQTPNFDYGYLLSNDDGYVADGNVYVAPEIGDWDDDGDMDMMIGVFYTGNVWYYENIATGPEPQYAPIVEIYADGSPISVSYG